MRRNRHRLDDPLVGWALVVMFVVTAFFFFLSFGPIDAFKNGPVPDFTRCCLGPNPLLQNHILVLFHPPILYLGYVGFTVPFAFAIAALITGRVGEGWLVATRRWALFAWGFLTVGIVLGGWWSYEVLGWGGVWGWDPVENASFLPWLTGTAYLHSVLVQERRGMLRVWNLSLLVATFSLTILGTFITRSGVLEQRARLQQRHDRAVPARRSSGSSSRSRSALIAWRGDRLRSPGRDRLARLARGRVPRQQRDLHGVRLHRAARHGVPADRRGAAGSADRRSAPPFFDRLSMPIGITLLFLMAIAPVLPWRKASTELLRDRLFWPAWCGAGALAVSVLRRCRRAGAAAGASSSAASPAARPMRQLVLAARRQGWRGLVGRANGGMVVHLGVIIIAVALAASNSYTQRRRVHPAAGQAGVVRGPHVRADRVAAVHRRPLDGSEGRDPRRRRQELRAGHHHVHQLRHQGADAQRAQRDRSTTCTSRWSRACASTAPRRR